MLVEAYVKKQINQNTIECIIAIDKSHSREQQIMLYPLKKRNDTFKIEDILYKPIYIWKPSFFKRNTNYLGKIIYTHENRVYIINQAFEEIFKRIE